MRGFGPGCRMGVSENEVEAPFTGVPRDPLSVSLRVPIRDL